MSSRSWQASLKASLKKIRKPEKAIRLAVVGVGHELCGDDAVGVRLAEMVKKLASGNERILAVEAGPAPENFTGTLRRFAPDLVLIVDAAAMDSVPGSVQWLDWQDAEGFGASTHTLPLHLMCSFLVTELQCQIALLGIQPEQTFMNTPLTQQVQKAVEEAAKEIVDCISIHP